MLTPHTRAAPAVGGVLIGEVDVLSGLIPQWISNLIADADFQRTVQRPPRRDDDRALPASVRDDWVGYGLSTEPVDRDKAERDIATAYRAVDPDSGGNQVIIWVDSPMAGVIASTSVGFAFREPMKRRLLAPLESANAVDVPAAQQIRRDIDNTVWRARDAVHAQVAAELAMRHTDASWEEKRRRSAAPRGMRCGTTSAIPDTDSWASRRGRRSLPACLRRT